MPVSCVCPNAELLQYRVEAAERQREAAVLAMQAVQPGVLSDKEAERLQRLRDYAYELQNAMDANPRVRMDRRRARHSAVCWAVTKISGIPFQTDAASSPQEEK